MAEGVQFIMQVVDAVETVDSSLAEAQGQRR
jgi:hypothetical protein